MKNNNLYNRICLILIMPIFFLSSCIPLINHPHKSQFTDIIHVYNNFDEPVDVRIGNGMKVNVQPGSEKRIGKVPIGEDFRIAVVADGKSVEGKISLWSIESNEDRVNKFRGPGNAYHLVLSRKFNVYVIPADKYHQVASLDISSLNQPPNFPAKLR